jgi:hypothetical protein
MRFNHQKGRIHNAQIPMLKSTYDDEFGPSYFR